VPEHVSDFVDRHRSPPVRQFALKLARETWDTPKARADGINA
jgi:hypothetical protein